MKALLLALALVAASAAPAAAAGPRIVTLGDSITAANYSNWPRTLTLPVVHNAGVGGNVTAQMEARLTTDVLAYHPTDVFLMGGTNDLIDGYSNERAYGSIVTIIDRLRAHGVRTWLLTIPPYTASWGLSSVARVISYNQGLIAVAHAHGARVINVWPSLATLAGTWRAGYSTDGIHPTAYAARRIAAVVQWFYLRHT